MTPLYDRYIHDNRPSYDRYLADDEPPLEGAALRAAACTRSTDAHTHTPFYTPFYTPPSCAVFVTHWAGVGKTAHDHSSTQSQQHTIAEQHTIAHTHTHRSTHRFTHRLTHRLTHRFTHPHRCPQAGGKKKQQHTIIRAAHTIKQQQHDQSSTQSQR